MQQQCKHGTPFARECIPCQIQYTETQIEGYEGHLRDRKEHLERLKKRLAANKAFDNPHHGHGHGEPRT